MFTSNGKLYCKQDYRNGFDGLIGLAGTQVDLNRGYTEDILVRPNGRTGYSVEANVNYDYEHFERRLPLQNSGNREFEEDQDYRRVRFRKEARPLYGEDAHGQRSGIRIGGNFAEGSLLGGDHGYSVSPEFIKKPPDFNRTSPEFNRTLPEFKPSPEFTTPPEINKTPPEFARSQSHGGHQSYGNQLLYLRAALNEKELQLVELREQHINVLNRAADSRHNWEEALKSKDRVILQLQRTLQHKKVQLERQDKEVQDNIRGALRKRQKEENAEVEKKDLKIALLEAKNAQFVQELVDQQKLITRMKRQIDEKEKVYASHCHKMEMMNGRVQDLKAALREKEEEADTQIRYCNELKTLLWKRDSLIAQLQLSEQQLQSTLARQEAAREALAVSRDKVQEEKTLIEKRLSEMKNQYAALENGASRSGHARGRQQSEMRNLMELKDDFSNVQEAALKDLDDREGMMHRIQKRMRELQRSLRSKDNALSSKNNDYQEALQENQRLTEEYEALRQECEEVSKRNSELESTLANLQEFADGRMGGSSISKVLTPPVEVLPYEFSQNGSIGEDLGVDEAMLGSMESEQLSNASVYHANFEKIKIIEVEMPDMESQQQQQEQKSTAHSPQPPRPHPPPLQPSGQPSPPRSPTAASPSPPPQPSSPPSAPLQTEIVGPSADADANFNSIQDEILHREKCWRKTEELMRAALTRRMKLLEEAKEGHSSEETRIDCGKWSEVKSSADRKTRQPQKNHLDRNKQIEDESSLDHRSAHRKNSQRDSHYGFKYHGLNTVRDHRHYCENDGYLAGKLTYVVDQYKKAYDEDNSRRRHEHGTSLDRRKNADRSTQVEYSRQYEHYGHYDQSGQPGRSGRMLKGRIT